MRRFFLLALVLLLTSCSSRERQALRYLEEQFPGAAFTVEDAGPVIPLYYPGSELMNIARLMKDPSSTEFEQACRNFEDAMDLERYSADHPDKCNAKGFIVWVKSPSGAMDVVFVVDGSGEVIDSTLGLQRRYNEILKAVYDL